MMMGSARLFSSAGKALKQSVEIYLAMQELLIGSSTLNSLEVGLWMVKQKFKILIKKVTVLLQLQLLSPPVFSC